MNTKVSKLSRNRIRDTAGLRISRLTSNGEIVFHATDAASFWDIRNDNTLYKTLSRYVRGGLIHRIHKGLYSIRPAKALDPYLLGTKAVHSFSYVSCESVLFAAGIINQPPTEITLVSSISKRFIVAGKRYRSRRLDPSHLFNDIGVEARDGVRVATAPRAIADMLYFNPKKHLDASSSGLIDWDGVRRIQTALDYTISP